MSDLKHRSPDELRQLIKWCERKRAEHRSSREVKEAEIERLKLEISDHGQAMNNIGQKEVWARKYLADKTEPYFVR